MGRRDAGRFNRIAAEGSEVYRFMAERHCPLLIDRVAGGALLIPYPYDQGLLRRYAALLGEWFLGGQVHEVLSNLENEWDRLACCSQKSSSSPTDPHHGR